MSLHSPGLRAEPNLITGATSNLTEVNWAMDSMTTQKDLAYFLNNPNNAQKFNGLVDDIHYALIDYRVCALKRLVLIASNICIRLHYNETSTTRAVKRL